MTVAAGTPVSFTATATDDTGVDISSTVQWVSGIEGVIGTGASVTANLSSGNHVITAQVLNSYGVPDVIDTRQVIVLGGQYPNVLVQSPAEGSTYSQLTNIMFSGSASDAEDGDISLNLQWSSSIDGPLGTGPSVTNVLSVGSHIITISITDSSENTTSVQRQITVTAL